MIWRNINCGLWTVDCGHLVLDIETICKDISISALIVILVIPPLPFALVSPVLGGQIEWGANINLFVMLLIYRRL